MSDYEINEQGIRDSYEADGSYATELAHIELAAILAAEAAGATPFEAALAGEAAVEAHLAAESEGEPMPIATHPPVTFLATFVKLDHAKTFVERMSDPGMWATVVGWNGRTKAVRFDVRVPAHINESRHELAMSYAETVGYHGAPPMGPIAKLVLDPDGDAIPVRVIRSY